MLYPQASTTCAERPSVFCFRRYGITRTRILVCSRRCCCCARTKTADAHRCRAAVARNPPVRPPAIALPNRNPFPQVWGGEHIHVGLYTMLEGKDAELVGVPKITKASSICTRELLARCFPSGNGPAPDTCTLLDLGSGYGGTARAAAKEFGCKVGPSPVLTTSIYISGGSTT